ncbi:MAG: TIGR00730 family Rossman fold protein [bacterium]
MPTKKKTKLPISRPKDILKIHDQEIETWRIFKIMAEFVSGFEFISKYEKAVTFFGSARSGFKDKLYQEVTKLAYDLSKEGFAVISGGGPGVMEAANKGAYEAGGKSVGINIKLTDSSGTEKRNQYVKEAESFEYFFIRKTILSFASQVYIFFPGGFGTLDELFEIITLIQTKKIKPIPVILVNKEYWQPLFGWINETIYNKNKAIDKDDMNIYHLVNNADEAFKLIKKLMQRRIAMRLYEDNI